MECSLFPPSVLPFPLFPLNLILVHLMCCYLSVLCMCLYMCVHCAYVHMALEARWSLPPLVAWATLSSDAESLMGLGFTQLQQTDWPKDPPGSPLCPPNIGVTCACHHIKLIKLLIIFYEKTIIKLFLGIKLVFLLACKHVTDWAIVQGLMYSK